MKAIIAILLLNLVSLPFEVKAADVSLEEAVNQAKSEGRVLSANTVNGKHEIKVLTPSGAVKTINRKAGSSQKKPKPPRSKYVKKDGQSFRNRNQNAVIPNRFTTQQKNRRMGSRQLDLQPPSNQGRNKNTKKITNNKKDKDK